MTRRSRLSSRYSRSNALSTNCAANSIAALPGSMSPFAHCSRLLAPCRSGFSPTLGSLGRSGEFVNQTLEGEQVWRGLCCGYDDFRLLFLRGLRFANVGVGTQLNERSCILEIQ